MYSYLVNLIDNKSNRLEDKEYISMLEYKEFKKWLRQELKNEGYGKILYLQIKEN